MKLRYRADIDGLRALAVLAVVFNHAGVALFSGGFTGVDVFFVISGYLITGIILREIETGSFSLVGFYERRIRRIYPALFAMLPFTLLAGALLYNAADFQDLGNSALAATFYASNFYFWNETGYFEGPAQLKPLLHTWSLAVEEQFYILFPPLVLLLTRSFKSALSGAFFALALVSLGISVYAVFYGDASAAFYLVHARVWELLAGGFLALRAGDMQASPKTRDWLSCAGLALIAAPIFLYSDETPFPGLAAVPSVLGAALLILSGTNGSARGNRLLSLPPLVFIGQISYSLYLWHWTIFSFGKYYAIRPLSGAQIFWLLCATLLVSALSWKFVETPFRERPFLKGKNVFLFAGTTMAVFALASAAIIFNEGFPAREGDLTRMDKNAEQRVWSVPCRLTGCPIGAAEAEPAFALWGDSLAPALADGISLSAARHGIAGRLVYANGCAPLIGVKRSKYSKRCLKNNDEIADYIKAHPELRVVIMVGRWALWVEGTSYNFMEDETKIRLTDTLAKGSEEEPAPVAFQRAFERTVAEMASANRQIVFVGQTPEIGYDVPSAYFVAQRTGRDVNEIIAPSLQEYRRRNANVERILAEVAQKFNAPIIEPWRAFCDESKCLTVAEGRALYMDAYHPSIFGSEYISHIYDPLFAEMAKNQK